MTAEVWHIWWFNDKGEWVGGRPEQATVVHIGAIIYRWAAGVGRRGMERNESG